MSPRALKRRRLVRRLATLQRRAERDYDDARRELRLAERVIARITGHCDRK